MSQQDRERIVNGTLEKQNVNTAATYAAGPAHYRAFWRDRGILNAAITEEGVVQFLESAKQEGHPKIVKYVRAFKMSLGGLQQSMGLRKLTFVHS